MRSSSVHRLTDGRVGIALRRRSVSVYKLARVKNLLLLIESPKFSDNVLFNQMATFSHSAMNNV
jgi:hypothetical protein